MALLLGVCTSTEGRDRERDVRDLGARVSRFVLTTSDDTRRRLPAWHRALGRLAHGVIARETFVGFGLDPYRDFVACMLRVRDQWPGQLDVLEPGNEPDDGWPGPPGDSSFGMTPQQFTDLLWAACQVFHLGQHDRPLLVSGGFNSGQPGYAEQVIFPPCVLLGLHSYDKSLDGWPAPNWGWGDLAAYILTYRPFWSKLRGVALSEWGHTSQDGPFGAEYAHRFLGVLRRIMAEPAPPRYLLAEWFALNDWQHRPHGLVLDDGWRRPQFHAYANQIVTEGVVALPRTPIIVGAGIQAEMNARGDFPIEQSWFKNNPNGSAIEEVRGLKGRYLATNAHPDEQWRTVFIAY